MTFPPACFAPAIDHLIGIAGDGGSTRARLRGADGTRLARGHGGPSALGRSTEQTRRRIRKRVDRASVAAGLGIGIASPEVDDRADRFLAAAPRHGRPMLRGGAETTLAGGHAGRRGEIVAVGTGTIGLAALDANDVRRTANGWGFSVGDENGGAWLGSRAMGLEPDAFDGALQMLRRHLDHQFATATR